MLRILYHSGVGVTKAPKAPLVSFPVAKFLILQRYLLDYLNHIHCCGAAAILVKYKRDTRYSTRVLTILKNSQNNGTVFGLKYSGQLDNSKSIPHLFEISRDLVIRIFTTQ